MESKGTMKGTDRQGCFLGGRLAIRVWKKTSVVLVHCVQLPCIFWLLRLFAGNRWHIRVYVPLAFTESWCFGLAELTITQTSLPYAEYQSQRTLFSLTTCNATFKLIL